MLIKCFTFPFFFFLFFFHSHVVSLSPSLSFSPPMSVSLGQPLADSVGRLSLRCYFTLMVLFFSLLSVFLSFPHTSVPLLHWRGQMLAGMIAEPAFLSEYTIFALDHSKRPKTAQVASVVSLSALPVSPSSSFSSSSSCPVTSSGLRASGESVEDCGPSRDSLFPALSPVSFGFSNLKASHI